MNNTICECERPIPQATLNHACQNCYKVLKEYAMKTPIIVWSKKGVTETTVTASPNATIKELCDVAFEQTENKPNSIVCITKGLSLDMLFKDLKFNLVLKWNKEDKNWILFRA